MKTTNWLKCTVALALAVTLPLSANAASVTLKANSSLPTSIAFSQQFLQFAKLVNAEPDLDINIRFLGGPEVIPPKQQAQALQNGVINMSYGPANYYFSKVPEAEALTAATVNATEARKNGGLALLNSIYEKKMNAHLLGWFGSGPRLYHIYTVDKPSFTSEGKIDGSMQVRSVDLYHDLLTGMGFSPITIQAPNVYTALQRGVVNGVAWPTIGITDLGWDKSLKYRLSPGFFRMNTIVLVNLDSWNKLSDQQRSKLQALAAQFDATSEDDFAQQAAQTEAKIAAEGMQEVELTGAALERYQELVRTVPWTNLKRLNGTNEAALKAHFAPTQHK